MGLNASLFFALIFKAFTVIKKGCINFFPALACGETRQ